MNSDVESLLAEVNDPRLVRGIYNYCHRRCDRCSFTDRCLTFRQSRKYEESHPGSSVFDQVRDSFRQTFELLKAWCEREGVDFEQIRAEAVSEGGDERSAKDAVEADTLYRIAMAYSRSSFDIVSSLELNAVANDWSREVRVAIETIGWYAFYVSAKIRRALHGQREHDGEIDDPVQNDWNGSAKAARLAIAESRNAWFAILEACDAPTDSPLRPMVQVLDRIDSEAAGRFPIAMEFVRPGFDEPDVAAGALTTLHCFEPRRR